MLSLDAEGARAYFARMTKPTIKQVFKVHMRMGYRNFEKIRKALVLAKLQRDWGDLLLRLQKV